MSYPLNNKQSADTYTAGNTLDNLAVCNRVNIDISFAAIYYQLKLAQREPDDGLYDWGPEIFADVGTDSLDRLCAGVRFRSAVAGSPATVTFELVPGRELP